MKVPPTSTPRIATGPSLGKAGSGHSVLRHVSERAELRLVGPGGEPVDLPRTLASHGFADLTPHTLDEDAQTLETTFALGRGARTVRISPGRRGYAAVETHLTASSPGR